MPCYVYESRIQSLIHLLTSQSPEKQQKSKLQDEKNFQ
jgi:hypothetical protein